MNEYISEQVTSWREVITYTITYTSVCALASMVPNSMRPYGLSPTRLLCPLGFSRQEYWSGLPFLSLGNLPDPVIEPAIPAFQVEALMLSQEGISDHVQFTLNHGSNIPGSYCSYCSSYCSTVLCSIGFYFHYQTHLQLSIVSTLAQPLHSFWSNN